jgi:hypothetical protein
MLKKTLITIAAVLAVLILGFVIVVAMQPSEFRVSRSAKMSAPANEVFEQVNDFHKWNNWSPWAKLDPNAKNSFDGPTAGEGSIFRWAGNADVGEGAMTITESKPAERVRLKLEFIKPMAGVSDTLFTFQPEGDQTTVTWTMSGENNFMGKAFSLFMDCDKMIGEQFDKGLANMKTIVEAEPTGPQIAASPSAAGTVAATPAESKSEN